MPTLRSVSILFLHGNDFQAVARQRDEALAGRDVQRVDLTVSGVRELVRAGSTPGMFTPTGVHATGGETIRVADAGALLEAAATPAPIVIQSTKAPGAWMQKRLAGHVNIVDCSVPKGNALNAYIAARGREHGVTLNAAARAVLSNACGADAARIRSVLWVCVTCSVMNPTAGQLEAITAGWQAETSAWVCVDKALNGDAEGAVRDAAHAPAAVIAHTLRVAANRLRELQSGEEPGGSHATLAALQRSLARGVNAEQLGRSAVRIDDALRCGDHETSVCAVQLARIAKQ